MLGSWYVGTLCWVPGMSELYVGFLVCRYSMLGSRYVGNLCWVPGM